jgi:hypothetical protein
MAQDKCYKLGQYEIIEDRNGTFWWRSHSGMADTKGGRCQIEGNILVLGPSEIQQSGPLRREFMEHLNKLPRWDQTEYYCPSHALHNSRTGARARFDTEMDDYSPESHGTSVRGSTHDIGKSAASARHHSYLKEIAGSMDVILEKARILLSRWSRRNTH